MGAAERIKKELAYISGMGRTLARVVPMARRRTRVFPDVAEELAARFGDRPALLSDGERLTYAEYNARGNRYARWALAAGLGKGDTVCLLMPNRPEFLAVWLGVARAGGCTALLNTNLSPRALAHCVNIVAPKHVIAAGELASLYEAAMPSIEGAPRLWWHGAGGRGGERIDTALEGMSDAAIPKAERPVLTHEDRCLYIYTSGTTGLPKAANVNHYRVLGAMLAFSAVTNAKADDRMYDCLPLYHTVGGVVATGACLMVGGSVFIRERFSARQFWDDVVDQGCTLFQYVGELCRYLLAAPPHPKEARHRLRVACGNGLRPDIWHAFKERFRLRHIREFYAATEGNALLFNLDDTVGAVGRVPAYARRLFPMALVRFDIDSEQPLRGGDGFCVPCADGEVGELVSPIIVDPLKPGNRFDGYSDRAATAAKILYDAFEKGDRWFRSGDLMRRDRHGYYYFVDRIGDTFRWKGENVATSEVAEALTGFPGVQIVNVYGVRVEHAEGRAGMAAIVAEPGFDLAGLRAHVHAHLSPFARPLFIRLRRSLEMTSTFKQRKVDLVREGFDPTATDDPLFFDDPESGRYVALDRALAGRIQRGEVRI
jgi:fatty-acyl-CoA synthase